MASDSIEDKTFDKEEFSSNPLPAKEFENCKFRNCDFANVDLTGKVFIECEFTACNLSLAKLKGTSFRDVKFRDCKMLGLRFDQCHTFGLEFRFENCILNHSTFFQLKIRKTIFSKSQLLEVDFNTTDLTGASFAECNLDRAYFENTILEKVDFTTASNYSLDPENNHLKKARFSTQGLPGLLGKYDIIIED